MRVVMHNNPHVRLGVVFSHGTTIQDWHKGGLLDREITYLTRLHERLGEVVALTYDKPGVELESLRPVASPIKVRENQLRLDYRAYGFLAPFLQTGHFKDLDAVRTTQLSGAWMAALASKRHGMPFILRCGYLRSLFYEKGGAPGWRIRLAKIMERFAVRSANHVFAATQSDIDALVALSGENIDKFTLLPNPIDSKMFQPTDSNTPWRGKILFIGRLHEQKNLEPLIDVVNESKMWELMIVGDGPLRNELQKRAKSQRISFHGFIPNSELPALLCSCDTFVLPSHFEGNPKSLLEAMSCGCAVIGAHSAGISNLIEDGETGILFENGVVGLNSALMRFEKDSKLRKKCSRGARQFILKNYDIDVIADREASIIQTVINDVSGADR